MSKDNFFEWLKENKININGKYKNKRWGSIKVKENDQWMIHVCVQYDENLEEYFTKEPQVKEIVNARNEYVGCGRCIEGKCAFTGFDLINPNEEEIEVAKKMILYRINAIKEDCVPNCSYIKLSLRTTDIEPCAIHKDCNPKCKAMKKY